MTDNVVELNMVTRLDIPPDRVLRAAIEANLTDVFIVGYDTDGDLYTASSKADGAELLWMLELTKKRLLEIGDGGKP